MFVNILFRLSRVHVHYQNYQKANEENVRENEHKHHTDKKTNVKRGLVG